MAVPSVMADLSSTANSNSPAGTESPSNADDFLRAIQAILRATESKGSDIASATTTDIGAATGGFVDVTGTTTITGLGTVAAGIVRTVRFTGALTLTYNATSLILPGSANITTANGDTAIFRSLGSGNWICIAYIPRSGGPIAGFVDTIPIVVGSSDATKKLRLELDTNLTTATTVVLTAQNRSGTNGVVEDQIFPISTSVGSNALTITLNPCAIAFRSGTLSSGTVNVRAVNSAITVVVSSGSTLGTANGVKATLGVVAIDNAGTVELAVANLSLIGSLSEDGVISTTAEGGAGAADTSGVWYSTTARSNVPYRLVGYVDISEATAGTWASNATVVQGAGGQGKVRRFGMVQVNTANGYGSTNTRIRRFTNTVANIGSDITYADSNTDGGSFTINTSGYYSISYNDQFNAQSNFGISVNSTQLTTAIASITQTNILSFATTAQANLVSHTSWTGYLNAGDVVRAHTTATATGTSTTGCQFTISRVA
jgi:hypothetical protein